MSSAVSLDGSNFGLQEEKNQLCLRALKCPYSFDVKTQLNKSKDRLLPQSIDWIHQDPKYKTWQNGDEVGLLWIKGGAGKGKTMMSIGIIEELSRPKMGPEESTVVTYFFCKYADSKLNTLEAIVKGLILQLVNQQPALKESLRAPWDESGRFKKDVMSWPILWDILLEMLDRCKCRRIYLIVDALDECQDHNGMTEFLRHIVLNGLSLKGKMKWLLTSRPFDGAEQELFTTHDQFHISLEVNSTQVSDADNEYIISKLDELSCRHKYGSMLKSQLEAELVAKAQGTFLWVSLVCKELEKLRNPHPSEQDCIRSMIGGSINSIQGTQLMSSNASPVNTTVFSPMRGRVRIAPPLSKTFNLWRSITGHGQGALDGQFLQVTAMACSPDARWVACGGYQSLLVWDAITGDLPRQINEFPWVTVTGVAFSPDGKQIVSGTRIGKLGLWHHTTIDSHNILDGCQSHEGSAISAVASLQMRLNGRNGSVITSIAFSPDGKQISCGSENNIRIWDMTKSLKSSDFLGPMIRSFLLPRLSRDIKTFSSDSRYLTTSIGPINLGDDTNGLHVPIASKSLHDLYVRDQWISYKGVPLLRILSDSSFRPRFYDAQGDQLVIMLEDGRFSSFCIDRKVLVSMVDDCSKFC
ncbi:G-protein beta WD- 40 repeats containing protein [Penicillium malachiteum]|uniref:G-protein beta WD- 40 repeats containing protein n=1 Tax=Penicillium malachiteum TaxID=1324776 RepID=A0AAD6HS99_9EURO|nr:G-protein beta WD- 40 repeats containing protein [Penicillium malachiteum]